MLEHYAVGSNTLYLQTRFFMILWPVKTSDGDGSRGSPGFWHKTDKEEVYTGVDQNFEGESNIPTSWSIDRGKGDIYWCWICRSFITPQIHLILNIREWEWNKIRVHQISLPPVENVDSLPWSLLWIFGASFSGWCGGHVTLPPCMVLLYWYNHSGYELFVSLDGAYVYFQ